MAFPSVDTARPEAASMSQTIQARLVPSHQRMTFLPRVFGRTSFMLGEAVVYNWMRRLCAGYTGGYWQFFDLSNGGFYMALEASAPEDAKLHLSVPTGNDFEGDLSYDAAGIVVTLFALNQLVWAGEEHLKDAYYRLRAFAAEHAECALILAAID